MDAEFSFSDELLDEFEAEATRRRAANIEKYNRAHQPEIKPEFSFNADNWLGRAMVCLSEPAPSRWSPAPGCIRLESERLYIHRYEIIPNEEDGHCQLYVATLKDFSSTPRAIVTMIATMDGGSIQWLETAVEYRRQGYALEFLQTLEAYCGDFHGHAATEEGAKFLLAYVRATQSKDSVDADGHRRDDDRFELAHLRDRQSEAD